MQNARQSVKVSEVNKTRGGGVSGLCFFVFCFCFISSL